MAGSALSAVKCRWLELDDWGIGYFKATKSRTCSTFNLCYLIMYEGGATFASALHILLDNDEGQDCQRPSF